MQSPLPISYMAAAIFMLSPKALLLRVVGALVRHDECTGSGIRHVVMHALGMIDLVTDACGCPLKLHELMREPVILQKGCGTGVN
jgi:hypothetical protein